MKVNLVDPYSNEKFVVVSTDQGKFYASKEGSGMYKINDNKKMVMLDTDEFQDMIDNWCHYHENNQDEMADAFEDSSRCSSGSSDANLLAQSLGSKWLQK